MRAQRTSRVARPKRGCLEASGAPSLKDGSEQHERAAPVGSRSGWTSRRRSVTANVPPLAGGPGHCGTGGRARRSRHAGDVTRRGAGRSRYFLALGDRPSGRGRTQPTGFEPASSRFWRPRATTSALRLRPAEILAGRASAQHRLSGRPGRPKTGAAGSLPPPCGKRRRNTPGAGPPALVVAGEDVPEAGQVRFLLLVVLVPAALVAKRHERLRVEALAEAVDLQAVVEAGLAEEVQALLPAVLRHPVGNVPAR